MEMKDRIVVERWLKSRLSINDVDRISRVGIVGNERFSNRAVSLYKKLAEWSDVRLSSRAQDIRWKLNKKWYENRIKRCRRICHALGADYIPADGSF